MSENQRRLAAMKYLVKINPKEYQIKRERLWYHDLINNEYKQIIYTNYKLYYENKEIESVNIDETPIQFPWQKEGFSPKEPKMKDGYYEKIKDNTYRYRCDTVFGANGICTNCRIEELEPSIKFFQRNKISNENSHTFVAPEPGFYEITATLSTDGSGQINSEVFKSKDVETLKAEIASTYKQILENQKIMSETKILVPESKKKRKKKS